MRALLSLVALVALTTLAASACDSESATKYQVTVHFNETVTQPDIDSVAGYLRSFDNDLDFLVQETFPPTGIATLSTDADDFCPRVEAELESRNYISGGDCREATDAPVTTPDAPVSDAPPTAQS